MKRIAVCLLSALAVLFCSVSCLESDSPISTGTIICDTVSPARLKSDAGDFLNITENKTTAIPDTVKRVMINCDVLTQHKDDAHEFDIRLLEFAPVTIAEPVLASETDREELGDDALDTTVWISGGYLNAFVSFTKLSGSNAEHTFNLVLDDTGSVSDTLFLTFTHNAYGESFDNPELDASKIAKSGKYFSYGIDKFIPSEKQSVILHIECLSFVTMDNIILREKVLKTGDLKYIR